MRVPIGFEDLWHRPRAADPDGGCGALAHADDTHRRRPLAIIEQNYFSAYVALAQANILSVEESAYVRQLLLAIAEPGVMPLNTISCASKPRTPRPVAHFSLA